MSKRKGGGPLFFKPARATAKKNPQADVVLAIDRLSAEGRGLAFHNGKPVFVPNTLPGETVRARIALDKREFAEAELRTIDVTAPERIQPRCELFGRCGGCALQMLDYSAQLQHKSATLARLLERHIQTFDEAIVASPWQYRHRARFAVGEHAGKPVIGFKAANSHRVVAVPACAILDDNLQPLVTMLPRWLEQLRQWQHIDEIRIAIDGDGKIALAWQARRALPAGDSARLQELCASAGVACANGALLYRIPSQASAFAFSLNDFTQVNPAINDRLVARVIEWLAVERQHTLADFFCGLGNFALPLAKHAARVTGYELDAAMVARAAENAAGQSNLEFRAADLFNSTAIPDSYDAAVLDPPRAGAKALCEQLAGAKSLQRIVYVSCNPQTLIRDIDILARGGFRVTRAALVDMFPQTGHIEAVVSLCRKPDVKVNRT